MTHLFRRSAALVSCAVMFGALMQLGGSVAQAADPPSPRTTPSQTTTYNQDGEKFSLTVSPTRIEVDPDDLQQVQKILVVNRGRSPLDVTVQKRNFTGAADGTLVFSRTAPYSASTWVTLDRKSFTIEPGTSHTVRATIDVPERPEAGDHQVALVFLVPAVRTKANISINRGIGTPVYITVPGPTDDSVSLSPLNAPAFSSGGTVDVAARLRNTGTIHRDFRGTTPLEMSTGGTSVRFPDFTVIRGSKRNIIASWDPPLLCICHVTVAFANPDGTPQSQTVRVIVFPVKLAAVVLAGLVALAGLALWRRRRWNAAVDSAVGRLTRTGEV